MSLNKTLDRLFDEIRREAKRNPDFADRLDAVVRLHGSRRDVAVEVSEAVAQGADGAQKKPSGAPEAPVKAARKLTGEPVGGRAALSPVGMFKREGEAALLAALAAQDLGALRALVTEHNLDPGGVTATLTRDELAAHVVAQAKRRAERDEKMFEY